MDDKKVNTIAAISVIALIIIIIVARVTLKLSSTFFLIFGAGVAVILAILACVLVNSSHNRRRKLLESQLKSQGQELRTEYSFLRKVAGVPIKFRYKEIEEATDGFQSLIGKGASASVFKGILSDGTSVAVKRIDDAEERGQKEFRSEVAAIASVHHVNLVRLVGYCNSTPSSSPKFLIYEFIPNGSLDCWIFQNRNQSRRRFRGCLSWNLRYQVAIDVARGLAYLHRDCRSRILHLDVKPENILLDENFRALVSDFGLSKLISKDQSQIVSTIRGTRGYLAPEWLLEQGVSDKTDIYSYGMVLLEIVGGRKNVMNMMDDNEEKEKGKKRWQYFPKIANEKVREGRVMEIVDPRLLESGGMDEREVSILVKVALWCVQEMPRLRPSMSQVIEMLEGRKRVEEPPDITRMVIVDLLSMDDSNNMPRSMSTQTSQISNVDYASSYSFDTTVLSGR